MMNISRVVPRLPRFFRRHRLIRGWLRLTGEDPIQLVRFHEDHRAWIDLRDKFLRLVLIDDTYDDEFFRVARPFLRRGGHYLDVGANFGLTSFGLCDEATRDRVVFHLFEANPDLIPILQRTRARYAGHDVRIVHGCVSSEAGSSRLCRTRDHTGATHVSASGDVEIANLRLDDYVVEAGVDRIPLVKIDIEGFELEAFRGFRRSMETGRVEAVLLEVAPQWLERQGENVAGVLAFLEEVGYECFFFRAGDRNLSTPMAAAVDVNGERLTVHPVDPAAIVHQTDVLALHASAYSNRIHRA